MCPKNSKKMEKSIQIAAEKFELLNVCTKRMNHMHFATIRRFVRYFSVAIVCVVEHVTMRDKKGCEICLE